MIGTFAMNELKWFLQSNFPTNAAIKLAFSEKMFFLSEIKKKKYRGFSLTTLTRFLIFPDVSILITVRSYINNSDLNKN